MSEDCEVQFTTAATRELAGIAKKNPKRAAIMYDLLARIEENGWTLSIHSRLIKVLRSQTCVGEIRDIGSGGYRLFMFWHDAEDIRELWICRILPKRDVEGTRRMNDVCDAVEEIRRRFLMEDE
jgi:hypothetical protein